MKLEMFLMFIYKTNFLSLFYL